VSIDLSARTSQQVLEDHVRLREEGDLETDLRRSYNAESARGDEVVIRDGVDSYLVEDGRIRAPTSHHTVVSTQASAATLPGDAEGRRQCVRRAEDEG
jgi:hypothetical protein